MHATVRRETGRTLASPSGDRARWLGHLSIDDDRAAPILLQSLCLGALTVADVEPHFLCVLVGGREYGRTYVLLICLSGPGG